MEQALLPDVLSKFDGIKKTYAKVNRAQTKRLAAISEGEKVPPTTEKRIAKLRHEIVELMDGIHLNNNWIDYLRAICMTSIGNSLAWKAGYYEWPFQPR